MAHLHGGARIDPTKPELISAWLPRQSWFGGGDPDVTLLGAYRFDDPDGEVGIETHLVRDGAGRTLQVPLTYRAAPLAGGETWLVGTTQHSVLGPRWVYDACGDPVYVAVLAATILTGGRQADVVREFSDGRSEPVDLAAQVEGSGTALDVPGGVGLVDLRDDGETTVLVTSVAEIVVRRVIGPGSSLLGDAELVGTWPGVDDPTVLAVARTS